MDFRIAGIFTVHAASLDVPSRYQPQVVTYAVRARAKGQLQPDGG
jgi:hypothetical protein